MMRAVVVLVVVFASTAFASEDSNLRNTQKLWEKYKSDFKKNYPEGDEQERYEVFKSSLKRIAALNKRNPVRKGESPVFGLTFTSDRYPHEKPSRGRKGHADHSFIDTVEVADSLETAVPSAIDWRLSRAVTPVKNQGQCGSCWAFSTAETVESGWYLQNEASNVPHELSPQQIASCVTACDGCGGGDTVTAFDYLKGEKNGLSPLAFWGYSQGLTPLSECSATSCTEACSSHNLADLTQYSFYTGPAAKVDGFTYATPACTGTCTTQNLEKLKASLAKFGPTSICVNAGAWDDYTGGVMSYNACGESGADYLDHCVQLVGYNATAPTPYWLVRNSWSTNWGEEGYIRLELSKNTCGLADEATLAKMKAPESGDAEFRELRMNSLRAVARGEVQYADVFPITRVQ